MKHKQDRESTRTAVQTALLGLIRTRVEADPRLADAPDRLMKTSLASLLEALLSSDGIKRESSRLWLDPEDAADAYEYLRGFGLTFDLAREPRLGANPSGKRNEGLFYTPVPVVRHIVGRTLDAISLKGGGDFLTVKLLDPAVGTGAFLAEALDQLTERVLAGKGRQQRSHVTRICESFAHRMEKACLQVPFGAQTAVRAFILENCLYGVDLDAVAVATAKALLIKRAFGAVPAPPDLKLNLRVGNALIGTPCGNPDVLARDAENRMHANLYLGAGHADAQTAAAWARAKQPVHWPLEFPEIFGTRTGFDAVVGNPPYEILSVKESGIDERRREQAYFRAVYRTCHGKLNTYRLMMERGLDLLKNGGVLGFIVPATLLADSTAEKLRRMLMDEARIVETVLIPEKARLFDRVTQALVILVAIKGEPTEFVAPVWWDGAGPVRSTAEVTITRREIDRSGHRIPVLRTSSEKKLLDLLDSHPPLRGGGSHAPAGIVHQGEVNLTVHRNLITSIPTRHPLVRGEHVHPFRVVHPSPRGERLDWVKDEFFGDTAGSSQRGRPWEQRRIVLGRVVNMATARRLKAAEVPVGALLGDMTNFVTDLTVPLPYLVGLLNSRLLNWRIKITSTNNYLSAAEIEALPVSRNVRGFRSQPALKQAETYLSAVDSRRCATIAENLKLVRAVLHARAPRSRAELLPVMIASLIDRILRDCRESSSGPDLSRQNLLDALVLTLYGAEEYAKVIETG